MKIFAIGSVILVASLLLTFASELGEQFSVPGSRYLVPTVEARVGRPLTPVSVAGVARRSVRRCAVGVYHCQLPNALSTDNLISQAGSNPVQPPDRQTVSYL
jgi:hypothetical protein